MRILLHRFSFLIIFAVIQSFADAETEKVFLLVHSKKLPGDIQFRAKVKLDQLHSTPPPNSTTFASHPAIVWKPSVATAPDNTASASTRNGASPSLGPARMPLPSRFAITTEIQAP